MKTYTIYYLAVHKVSLTAYACISLLTVLLAGGHRVKPHEIKQAGKNGIKCIIRRIGWRLVEGNQRAARDQKHKHLISFQDAEDVCIGVLKGTAYEHASNTAVGDLVTEASHRHLVQPDQPSVN